jgi:hypothetical protein
MAKRVKLALQRVSRSTVLIGMIFQRLFGLRNLMALAGRLHVETGSEKFKIAAA